MIAIVAYWTSEDYEVKTALLVIREVHGEHTGENIANVVYPVLKEYNIHDRFRYFVGDNATNNDTSVEWLNQLLRDEDTTDSNLIDDDSVVLPMRCKSPLKDYYLGPK